MKIPDLNYLKAFYCVVKYGGFTKAALELHVQQPVVSRAVKLLEEDLHCQLIERQKKQVLLTSEGKQIYALCETLFKTAHEIGILAADARNDVSGEISFAASDSFAQGLFGPIFHVFKQKYPDLRLSHHSGSAHLMLEGIQRGDIDFGFFFNVPDLPLDLSKSKLCQVDFEYVMSAKAKDREVEFIATHEAGRNPEDLPLFRKYKKYFPEAIVSSISNSSITRLSMVREGLGVSVLPFFMVRDELDKGTLKTVMKSESIALQLIERKSSFRSKVKLELVNKVVEAVKG